MYQTSYLVRNLVLAASVIAGAAVGDIIADKLPNYNVVVNNSQVNEVSVGVGTAALVAGPLLKKGFYNDVVGAFGAGVLASALSGVISSVAHQHITPPVGFAQPVQQVVAQPVAAGYNEDAEKEMGFAQSTS
ncbi:MAG: hypothetical protein QXV17_04660 [Candidatus Micrarchaeaceae archaeon]